MKTLQDLESLIKELGEADLYLQDKSDSAYSAIWSACMKVSCQDMTGFVRKTEELQKRNRELLYAAENAFFEIAQKAESESKSESKGKRIAISADNNSTDSVSETEEEEIKELEWRDTIESWFDAYDQVTIDQICPFLQLAKLSITTAGNQQGIEKQKLDVAKIFWEYEIFCKNAPILTILFLLYGDVKKSDLKILMTPDRRDQKTGWQEHLDKCYKYARGRFDYCKENLILYKRNSQEFSNRFTDAEFLAAVCFQYMMYKVKEASKKGTILKIDCEAQWEYFHLIWPYDWQIFWPALQTKKQSSWIGKMKINVGDIHKRFGEIKAIHKLREDTLKGSEISGFWLLKSKRELEDIDEAIQEYCNASKVYCLVKDYFQDSLLQALLHGPFKTYYGKSLFVFGGGAVETYKTFKRPYKVPERRIFTVEIPKQIKTVQSQDGVYIVSYADKEIEELEKEQRIEEWYKEQEDVADTQNGKHERNVLQNKGRIERNGHPWRYSKIASHLDSSFLNRIIMHRHSLTIDELMFENSENNFEDAARQ